MGKGIGIKRVGGSRRVTSDTATLMESRQCDRVTLRHFPTGRPVAPTPPAHLTPSAEKGLCGGRSRSTTNKNRSQFVGRDGARTLAVARRVTPLVTAELVDTERRGPGDDMVAVTL